MNLKTWILLTGVLAMHFACKNGGKSEAQKDSSLKSNSTSLSDMSEPESLQQLRILYNVFNRSESDSLIGADDEGREVAMDSALQCTNFFEGEMYKHAIQINAGLNRKLGSILSRKITKYETFGGKGLLEYITKMVKLLDPKGEGKNMEFQLHMGIYTEPFLAAYYPDNEEIRIQKRNRITIFLIPAGRNSFKFGDDDDVTAYELGGVQP